MENNRQWFLIQYKLQEYKLAKAFELFRENKIEPILIKGWAAAQFYTEKEKRQFVDIDICVAPKDYERAKEILPICRDSGLMIDLHNGLRHLDTLNWENLFENTKLIRLGKTSIRVLRPEDNLRVTCVHWLNDGAADREKLWDIYYAVENRSEDFDWQRCLDTIDRKRRKWIVCAIGLARKYLGLKLQDTPIALEAERIPAWIIKTVESEWADKNKLKRLQDCLNDRREFLTQLKKRFPPNAIQATIDMNGEFDDKSRFFYQLGDIFLRAKPSIGRFIAGIKKK